MLAKTDVIPATSRRYHTSRIWSFVSEWFEKSMICAAIAPAMMVENDVPRMGCSPGPNTMPSPRRAKLYVFGTAAGLKPVRSGSPSAVENRHNTLDDCERQPGYVTLLVRPKLEAAAKMMVLWSGLSPVVATIALYKAMRWGLGSGLKPEGRHIISTFHCIFACIMACWYV